jgi:uroporphyrin-3 C-methyltransferase
VSAALVIALVALGLAVWQLVDGRRDAAALQADVARRLAEADASGRETRLIAEQVRNATRDLETRMGLLEARLLETQNQRIALEALYQELARNRDEWVLAEIEQILVTASQQLQLAGNVRAALIALEAADQRLERADRPHLLPIRKIINRDIDRLKALPAVDVPGLTLKLDNLIAEIDALPVAAEPRPADRRATARPAVSGWWARLGNEVWADLKELFRIRVADTRSVPFLPPEQAYFVRENLKLKLLSARLALLGRDEAGFRADLTTAADWLGQHFDADDTRVKSARAVLRQLSESEVSIRLPDIADSLEAVRSQRRIRERALR